MLPAAPAPVDVPAIGVVLVPAVEVPAAPLVVAPALSSIGAASCVGVDEQAAMDSASRTTARFLIMKAS